MELLAALGGGSFVVVCWVVGVRLLLVASRTRQLPELAVGLGLLLMGGIGYPILSVIQQAPIAIEIKRPLLLVHMLCHIIGDSALAFFTFRVFRNGVGWARVLMLAICGAIAGLAAAQAFGIGLDAFILADRGPWTDHASVALLPLIWTGSESILYYAMMRRRVRIGLADALVADRFRLWAFGTLAAASIAVTSVVLTAFGLQLATVSWAGLVIGPLGLAAGTSMWIAFLPPDWYVRRLAATA